MSGAPGISGEELSALVWQARTLEEVLRSAQRAGPEQSGPEAEPELVRRWRAAYSGSDLAAFRRRLEWDGLDLADVAAADHALREGRSVVTEDLPAWVRGLTAALSRGRHEAPELARRGLPASLAEGWQGDPPPFAELWVPFVQLAREDVERRLGGDTRPLEGAAFAALERYLLLQLSSVAELALYEQFDAARAARGAGSDPRGREVYAAFLAEMFDGGLGRALACHAALARRVWRLLSTWVTTTAELLERLRRDLPAITETLCDGMPPGGVVGIVPGLSDRHDGGRQVAVLRFRSGLSVAYKPRDVGIEVAFHELLRWLSAAGLRDVPPPLRMLGREGYGWAEVVERGPLPSQEALRKYHRRAGGLVCLTYLLGGADLHMDNVIAGTGGPVLIDAEALLQPPGLARLLEEGSTREGADRPEDEVCIATGLVTFPVLDPHGDPYEIGGLTGSGGYLTDPAHRVWRSVNTDAMRWDRVEARAPGMANLPLFEGEECLPFQFADGLCQGFEAAYRFLTVRRTALLAEGGPLAGFDHVASRVVLRPSALYVVVLSRLATPRFQLAGVDAGVLIDSLNTVFKSASSRPVLWPLVAGERIALEGLDVPRFTVRTDSTDVTGPDGSTATGALHRTAFAAMVDRIRGLGEADLVRQVAVLRRSLGVAALRHALSRSGPPGGAPSAPGSAPWRPARVPESVLLDWAAEAGERIASGLGEALSVSMAEPGLRPFYLYDGLTGPALFLTALARLSRRPAWTEAAAPVWRQLSARVEALGGAVAGEPLGACTGVGGVIYALAGAAALGGGPDLLECAGRLAAGIGEAEAVADGRLDVEGGCAGAILGLLALHALTGDAELLARATTLARRLLACAEPRQGGLAWPGDEGRYLAGFAHGASGIAYALARLARLGDRGELAGAVRSAFLFERSLFVPGSANWAVAPSPGPRDGPPTPMVAWCHGAPGVAVARMGALGVVGDASVREELEIALGTTRRARLSGLDHMCCGNLGVIDVLLMGGEMLEREELVRAAWFRATSVLTRAAARGGFGLEGGPEAPRLGFFRGLSGVGYQFLRLAAPADLPSVLAFEAPRGRLAGEERA